MKEEIGTNTTVLVPALEATIVGDYTGTIHDCERSHKRREKNKHVEGYTRSTLNKPIKCGSEFPRSLRPIPYSLHTCFLRPSGSSSMRATRQSREHHASAQRGQRGKSTPAVAHVAQWTRSRMSREDFSIEVSVGGIGVDVVRLGSSAVDARTGGGGRMILTRSWCCCCCREGMGILAEDAGRRVGIVAYSLPLPLHWLALSLGCTSSSSSSTGLSTMTATSSSSCSAPRPTGQLGRGVPTMTVRFSGVRKLRPSREPSILRKPLEAAAEAEDLEADPERWLGGWMGSTRSGR
jgi:hypothetical protein